MRLHSAQDVAKLRGILLQRSVRFGNFTLASGQTTDVYVDAKLTTCSPEAMPLVGRIFLAKLREKGWEPEAVGGLTTGADPIAWAIARESLDYGKPLTAFIVRKTAKEHGRKRPIEGIEDPKGCKVVVIDDVCSTGWSTAEAIEKAKAQGMEVIGAVCLVDRSMGASELLASKFNCELESIFKLSDLRAEYERTHARAERPVEAAV